MKKTNSGFTLIEVMLTIMIVSLTIGPLYALFSTVISSFTRRTRTYEALSTAYSELLTASVKQEISEKQTSELSLKQISPTASLSNFETIEAWQASVNWTDQGARRTGRLVMYINQQGDSNEE